MRTMEAGVGTTIRVIRPNHPRCGETGRIVVDERLTDGVLVKFDKVKDGAPGAFLRGAPRGCIARSSKLRGGGARRRPRCGHAGSLVDSARPWMTPQADLA